MGFTKRTGVEEPLSKAKIVSSEKIEEAKNLVKEGSQSLIDAVEDAEDEDKEPNS